MTMEIWNWGLPSNTAFACSIILALSIFAEFSTVGTMAFFGHTGRQRPQPTHLSVSILHFPFSKVGALWAQAEAHLWQPNTVPQTTTLEALADKTALGSQKSHVNYAFFYGATNDNVESFSQLDRHRIPGIKLFMGSSTGNMLVDKAESLRRIFQGYKNYFFRMAEVREIDVQDKAIHTSVGTIHYNYLVLAKAARRLLSIIETLRSIWRLLNSFIVVNLSFILQSFYPLIRPQS